MHFNQKVNIYLQLLDRIIDYMENHNEDGKYNAAIELLKQKYDGFAEKFLPRSECFASKRLNNQRT